MNTFDTRTLLSPDLIDRRHVANTIVMNFDSFVHECMEKDLKPTYDLFSLWMELFHSGVE
jgi:hypothetical protein